MNITAIKTKRGRPSAFNKDEVLEKALQVFWLRGYEAASMAEITDAMGISRPSIYNAFGNKEALFDQVLQKYVDGPVSFVRKSIQEPTAKQVVEKFLTGTVELFTNDQLRRGCLIAQAALSCSQESSLVKQKLIQRRNNYETAMRIRFESAQKSHDLPSNTNPATLAKYIVTVQQGMSLQATSGATKADLMGIVNIVLDNWPVGS